MAKKPPNAVSGSVSKGHVRHLNDLISVGRSKPFRVKSIHRKGGLVNFYHYCLSLSTNNPPPRVCPKGRVMMQTPDCGKNSSALWE